MTVISTARLGTGVAVVGLAVIVAGCGSSSSGGSGGSGGSTLAPASSVSASSFHTRSTPLGAVLVTSKGRTIYELAGDTSGHQTCTTACQGFWPPVMSGDSLVVINGHPAFTFTEDSASGQTHGQGVKDTWGTWWVLDASGNPITSSGASTASSPASPPASSSSGGSGGYGY
jgi:predicted lipoprotein with Yx(FWY)xxD motif